MEQALSAQDKREPFIAMDEVPHRGELSRIRCQPAGLLAGVGRAFSCSVEYRGVSTMTCAAVDRGRLVRCLGAPTCTRLHRPGRGPTTKIRYRHPHFGWRLDYPARLYFFSCSHFARVTYFQTVISNFDTRAGRLLDAGSDAFPEGGVALRIFAMLGGPHRGDVADTPLPLELGAFSREEPFARADTVLGHAFALDNQGFSVQMYFDSLAPRRDLEAIEETVRSIRRAGAS